MRVNLHERELELLAQGWVGRIDGSCDDGGCGPDRIENG
jgi:hypothetical protein